MTGNRSGGLKAKAKLLARDKDWYQHIGRLGGQQYNPNYPKGFACNPELARIAGAKGGKISKRGKAKHAEF